MSARFASRTRLLIASALVAGGMTASTGCQGELTGAYDEGFGATEPMLEPASRHRTPGGSTPDGGTETPATPGSTNPGTTPPGPIVTPSPEAPPVTTAGDFAVQAELRPNGDIALSWTPPAGVTALRVAFGAEPPTSAGLPGPTESIDLDASAAAHVITGVAPGMTVFAQVLATTSGGNQAGSVAVRTPSGWEVAGPLAHVYSFGADVLMVEVRDSHIAPSDAQSRGARWTGGTWRVVRHDGREIAVTGVHHRTQVVGQPDYPVGFEQWGTDDVVDAAHSIFLTLAEPVGSPELVKVEHVDGSTTDVSSWVPFSDSYIETPLVQVNQVGYNPRATRRWAYVSGYMGDGGGVDLSRLPATVDVLASPNGDLLQPRVAVRTSLPVTARSASDAHAGGAVNEIDLAGVPADETREYRVRLPGVGVSFKTAVSERAVFDAYYTVLRGLFHNRWCGDLAPAYTEWSRPADHCSAYFVGGKGYQDGMFSPDENRDDPRALIGGHHDAGDFDIRPFHVLVGQYLLRAAELGASNLADSQLRVPESGNGIPDVLDEALWSVEAWRQLQNPDGSVRAGVESYREPAGIYPADEDELPYFTYDPEPWHTAYVAALFAQAARLVRPYDAGRSAQLADAARNAYDSSVAQSAPAAYRLYAASELAALTGEERYANDFEQRWGELDKYGNGAFDSYDPMINIYPGSFTEHTPVMADFVMGYFLSPVADGAIVATITEGLRSRADDAANLVLDSAHAHRNGTGESDSPDWGRLASTGRHVDAIYQALEIPGLAADVKQRYLDAVSVAADYALGTNPAGVTYLTGLGTRSPHQVLHNDSLSALAVGRPPVPGIPVYGPISSVPGASYYQAFRVGFFPTIDATPLAYRYIDSRTAVTSSEFTVWENQAPFAELFTALFAAR